jgi:hypothetical protein
MCVLKEGRLSINLGSDLVRRAIIRLDALAHHLCLLKQNRSVDGVVRCADPIQHDQLGQFFTRNYIPNRDPTYGSWASELGLKRNISAGFRSF